MKWKPDWPKARENLVRWWRGEGLAFCLLAPRPEPLESLPAPPAPEDVAVRWTDPCYRLAKAEHDMAHTWFAGEAFPYFDTQIGPGSLGLFLGVEPGFAPSTVWYEPCIQDPDAFGAIQFRPGNNRWLDVHLALIEHGLARAQDRYLVGVPDLIENLDTLAAMRDNQALLLDLLERPAWVQQKLHEINEAWFAAFELMFQKVKDDQGGNAFAAFRIWGPGRTAKVQCDFSCMISPKMFRDFVVPPLREQCDWLDFALYHLDGPDAIQHLDALLEIESLRAIQWQPGTGTFNSAHPHWYDLLGRIRAGGKGVQTGAFPDQVIPLLDTFGPEGLFITCRAEDEESAARLLERVEAYR